jgi:hypothetical protein
MNLKETSMKSDKGRVPLSKKTAVVPVANEVTLRVEVRDKPDMGPLGSRNAHASLLCAIPLLNLGTGRTEEVLRTVFVPPSAAGSLAGVKLGDMLLLKGVLGHHVTNRAQLEVSASSVEVLR